MRNSEESIICVVLSPGKRGYRRSRIGQRNLTENATNEALESQNVINFVPTSKRGVYRFGNLKRNRDEIRA